MKNRKWKQLFLWSWCKGIVPKARGFVFFILHLNFSSNNLSYLVIYEIQFRFFRISSTANSTYCSSYQSEFGTQLPHMVVHTCLYFGWRGIYSLSVLYGLLYTNSHSHRHTHLLIQKASLNIHICKNS